MAEKGGIAHQLLHELPKKVKEKGRDKTQVFPVGSQKTAEICAGEPLAVLAVLPRNQLRPKFL